MAWFDLFPPSISIPPVVPSSTTTTTETTETWTTTRMSNESYPLEKFKALADSDGNIKLDFNGTTFTIPALVRQAFLEKIRTAVNMADVADPANDPLHRALK